MTTLVVVVLILVLVVVVLITGAGVGASASAGTGIGAAGADTSVCNSQGSGVSLVQSQRRKQFPKNPVDGPRGQRGCPAPFTQERKTPQASRRS